MVSAWMATFERASVVAEVWTRAQLRDDAHAAVRAGEPEEHPVARREAAVEESCSLAVENRPGVSMTVTKISTQKVKARTPRSSRKVRIIWCAITYECARHHRNDHHRHAVRSRVVLRATPLHEY